MKNKTKFNWKCAHYNCGKRNIDTFNFQFDVPKSYGVEMQCSKCGNITKIDFNLTTTTVCKKRN